MLLIAKYMIDVHGDAAHQEHNKKHCFDQVVNELKKHVQFKNVTRDSDAEKGLAEYESRLMVFPQEKWSSFVDELRKLPETTQKPEQMKESIKHLLLQILS